jgi:hypothetical protein
VVSRPVPQIVERSGSGADESGRGRVAVTERDIQAGLRALSARPGRGGDVIKKYVCLRATADDQRSYERGVIYDLPEDHPCIGYFRPAAEVRDPQNPGPPPSQAQAAAVQAAAAKRSAAKRSAAKREA